MKFDFISQRIVAQLDVFYNSAHLVVDENGKHNSKLTRVCVSKMFHYDFIYDHLEREGNKIDFPPQVKAELWELAKQSFKLWEHHDPTDEDEKTLIRYYKSYLAKQFLLNKLPERMFIYDAETGKRITRIELKMKYGK